MLIARAKKCLRLRSHDAGAFETVNNVTARPLVHTKTTHFLPAEFEMVDFENGTLTCTF